MKTSPKGIALIKLFEGCELKAYRCPAKVLTIGYGHTGADVTENMVIDAAKAESLLQRDLVVFEDHLNRCKLGLNQNQFDALVSFCYNVGIGNFDKSTLKQRIINNPNDPNIQIQFMRWNKVNGVMNKGLTNRRGKESILYFAK